jgi:importin subunit alpha-6/7
MDQSAFKNVSKDSEHAREVRRSDRVEIRKRDRESQALKRRNVDQAALEAAVAAEPSVSHVADHLQGLMDGLSSSVITDQLLATARLRRLLSQADFVDGILDVIVDVGHVETLVSFLSREDYPVLQFEACWCLTNIASGQDRHTIAVVKSGAVPKFVELLSSTSKEVREQALWAIGNIAGDGPKLRDMTIELGLVERVLSMFSTEAPLSLLRTITWTLANFCRGRPPPNFDRVRPIAPFIAQLIYSEDDQILIDSAWALSYLTDGDNEQIEEVVRYNVIPRLVALLSIGNHELQKPTLRTLGNIVTGDESQTQAVLDCNPLPVFHRLLHSSRDYIRKETCWALSNVLAGTSDQLDLVCPVFLGIVSLAVVILFVSICLSDVLHSRLISSTYIRSISSHFSAVYLLAGNWRQYHSSADFLDVRL